MLNSMTGFGSAQGEISGVQIQVDLKSVNHRHLDVSCKLPYIYQAKELEVVSLVKNKLHRGRVDAYVSRTINNYAEKEIALNKKKFGRYLEVYQNAFSEAGLSLSKKNKIKLVLEILRQKDIFNEYQTIEKVSEEEINFLFRLTNAALDELIKMRKFEGTNLATDLQNHLQGLIENLEKIKNYSSKFVEIFRKRLEQKLLQLTDVQLEPNRLAQEVAILAERTDITEEITRLETHINHFQNFFGEENPGKKLDFLMQEMNREINTIGSKCQNSSITHLVVDSKSLLEKLREQIQNIE